MLTTDERRALKARVGPEVCDAMATLVERAGDVDCELCGYTRAASLAISEAHDALLLAIDRLREGGNG